MFVYLKKKEGGLYIMNKKTVVSVLVCIVMLGSAISANAANIFSDDFSHRTPWYLNHYFPDSNTWEITYDQQGWDYATVWWDVTSNWKVVPPEDPNDANLYFLVLGQWGKNNNSDAGVVTKEYQNVSGGLSYLTVKCKISLEPYGNPIIQLKVKFWDNNTPGQVLKGEVVTLIVDPNVPTDRLVWKDYSGIIAVPAGAGVAKFAINNDSSPVNEGTVWIDDFIVSDVVCMDPPSLDVTGDCKVGLADLAELSAEWLSCGKVIQADCW